MGNAVLNPSSSSSNNRNGVALIIVEEKKRGSYRFAWEICNVLLLLWNVWSVTFRMAFWSTYNPLEKLDGDGYTFLTLDSLADLISWINLLAVLRFRRTTARMVSSKGVFPAVSKSPFDAYFFLELLALLPYEFLAAGLGVRKVIVFRLPVS